MSQQPIVVTIEKGNINPTVSIVGWTYGESPKTPTVTDNTGNGDVTYEYKVKGAADDDYSDAVPTDAGDYTVRATIADTGTYNEGIATADFTIKKASLPDQVVRVVGYIGTVDDGGSTYHYETNIEQSVANMMPNDAGVLTYDAGSPSYKGGATKLPAGVEFTYEVDHDTGVVTAKLTIPSTYEEIPEAVQEITLPVTVTSKNYEDSTISVVVVPTKKGKKDVTISGTPASKTYGDDAFTLTATVNDDQAKAEDWYWYSSDPDVLEVRPIADPNTGSSTVEVTVKKPGPAMILAWYEPSDGSTIGATLTGPITVNKISISPSVRRQPDSAARRSRSTR